MDPRDLFLLLIMSLRYSLRRHDDGSADTFNRLIRMYGPHLNVEHRKQIVAEIGEAVRASSVSGGWCSRAEQQTWEAIAGYLAELAPESATMPSVEERKAIKEHRIIDAIKALRMRSNLGLREAKDMVDMWRDNPQKYGLL